jgi:hypothetical protein
VAIVELFLKLVEFFLQLSEFFLKLAESCYFVTETIAELFLNWQGFMKLAE